MVEENDPRTFHCLEKGFALFAGSVTYKGTVACRWLQGQLQHQPLSLFPHPFWPHPAVREGTTHPHASYCYDKMTGDSHSQLEKWELLLLSRGDNRQAGCSRRQGSLIWRFLENGLMSPFQNQSLKQKQPKQTNQPSIKGKPLHFQLLK